MTIEHAVENLKKHLQNGSTVYLVIRRITTSGHAVSVYSGGIECITNYVAVAGGLKVSRDSQSLIINGGCSHIVDIIETATGLVNLKYRILT